MLLRPYQPEDIQAISRLFYDTVHTVNARDYTQEQLDAWACGTIDQDAWNRSFLSHTALVAVEENVIVGFGDIDSTGYLDRLYVHKDRQGQGIATALLCRLEASVSCAKIVTHASITAKPFFQRRGYRAVRRRQVERRGVLLTNYIMEKPLIPPV